MDGLNTSARTILQCERQFLNYFDPRITNARKDARKVIMK